MIDPDASDPPELLAGPALDLGAIAVEHFLLAVDLYPRAPGAELPARMSRRSPGEACRFAVCGARADCAEDQPECPEIGQQPIVS